jgi:hypothetical protein
MDTRALLRRAGALSLTALLLPAAADAAKPRSPVVAKVAPKRVFVGETLTLHGRHFRRGVGRNTVAFKREGAKVVFVRADKSTAKLMKVELPKRLEKALKMVNGARVPTRLRVRVLAARFGKRYTSTARSPIVGPEKPPAPPRPPAADPVGDCDGDRALNRDDADDDNDLLGDELEKQLRLDQCRADSDGDGVTDGYEYQSARDLNDDEYQEPQTILPAPEKRPYPNPLYSDAGVDYDGDSLRLGQEFALWKSFRNPAAGLNDLVYSDGNQYSAYLRDGTGRRPGALVGPDPHGKYADFFGWASAAGYATVWLPRGQGVSGDAEAPGFFALRDLNQDGSLAVREERYFDFDLDGKLSDDERDEDADGLTNYDEATGRNTSGYWVACYTSEKPYPITYAGTDLVDGDSDGDGVRDGADDQDHDDIPNVMELSRRAAADPRLRDGVCGKDTGAASPLPVHGRVNPYNPCLPYVDSRTCERHPAIEKPYAPFDPNTPNYLILN